MSPECWLNLNGWGDALYMDGGQDQADECRRLRGDEECYIHYYMPASWRHTDWCKTPTGHDGDCWRENNRVLGIKPIPAGQPVIEIRRA
jgi:hypothetical protein